MLTVITLPEGFVASATAYIGDITLDLLPIWLVVIGLPLGFWFMRRVMGVFPRR